MKVSVCIQTYNHGPYIAQALDSVLMQETDFDFEIVVGEDESQDETRAVCIEYAERHPDRIRLFLRSREDVIYINGVPTGRFNFASNLLAARGTYIALLDGDDYWRDPHKLQKQADFLDENPDCVLCHHNAIVVDEAGDLMAESKLPPHLTRDLSQQQLMANPSILTLSAFFRNVFDVFPPEFFQVFNADTFVFSLLGAHGRSRYMGDVIEPDAYRVHGGGVWSAQTDNWNKVLQNLNTLCWLRSYYLRTGERQHAKEIGRILPFTVLFCELASAEEVRSRLANELARVERNVGSSGVDEHSRAAVWSWLSANLYVGAAFALFAWRCWDEGSEYLRRAVELDPEAWHDKTRWQKMLLQQGQIVAGLPEACDGARLDNYVEGIKRYLPGDLELPRAASGQVRGWLYAEAAFRCHMADDMAGCRRFTRKALWADPALTTDAGMLRRSVNM